MQIPPSYVDVVIGIAGSNISYIRRASGATVTVQETRGVPREMTVEVNGTASQNFMADAATPQTQTSASMAIINPYGIHIS
ncbi:hypothetical protein L6452_40413 [Arctium lappa]|uniref:Uncharacterized protein n=1 Tax=Arctium lappa TaxID=4217 RepID=A0ACB8XLU7_ARCLA|nr:hypothetical protein L6452_40413 [Arctium lappa]